MKFLRVGEPGAERPVVRADGGPGPGRTYDLRPLTERIDGAFLASGGVERTREALAEGTLRETDCSALRVGAPVERPSAVVCIGMNYAAHAAESGAGPPASPVVFLKTPNTVTGPYDTGRIPPGSRTTDWEVELGVVIGRRTSYLEGPWQSRDHVAGYVLANDLSERTAQLDESGGQWSKGKCAPGFTPLGPWFVPADEVDPGRLALRSWVNGEPRQDSTTADMVFGVDVLVHHLSRYMALEPGDVVLTGTPEGVALSGRFPYLGDGDVVETEISGLGRARQRFEQG